MSGDHAHCAKHPDRLALTLIGHEQFPVCRECFDAIVRERKDNYEKQRSKREIEWGGSK